jgi:hypothetical protein
MSWDLGDFRNLWQASNWDEVKGEFVWSEVKEWGGPVSAYMNLKFEVNKKDNRSNSSKDDSRLGAKIISEWLGMPGRLE